MNTPHAGTNVAAETSAFGASGATAAGYASELAGGVARLGFEPSVESEFRLSHVVRVRTQARLWQLLQVVAGLMGLYVVFGGQSWEGARALLLTCSAVHLAVSAVLVTFAFSRAYPSSYYVFATILTPFRAAAFAVIIAAIIDAGGSGTAVLIINLFGLLFFSGLLLRQALPAALVMTASFFVALTSFGVHTALAAYSMTSLLVVFGLAGFVAWDMQVAARKAFLEHRLSRLDATRDALTGLVNRRYFDSRLEALWQASAEQQRPLTVMLIDVDLFKAYNDSYGHQAGDDVLRRVAQALAAQAQTANVVSRFGGEEFALVTSGLDECEAEGLAGKMRGAVETLSIAHKAAPPIGKVTVSIGGACIVPLPGRSAAGALQMADQNLYAAKRQGRNRVVFQRDGYTMLQTGRFRRPDADKGGR